MGDSNTHTHRKKNKVKEKMKSILVRVSVMVNFYLPTHINKLELGRTCTESVVTAGTSQPHHTIS